MEQLKEGKCVAEAFKTFLKANELNVKEARIKPERFWKVEKSVDVARGWNIFLDSEISKKNSEEFW